MNMVLEKSQIVRIEIYINITLKEGIGRVRLPDGYFYLHIYLSSKRQVCTKRLLLIFSKIILLSS